MTVLKRGAPEPDPHVVDGRDDSRPEPGPRERRSQTAHMGADALIAR